MNRATRTGKRLRFDAFDRGGQVAEAEAELDRVLERLKKDPK